MLSSKTNGTNTCKAKGNKISYVSNDGYTMTMSFDSPHHDYMPLVGDENRPKSIIWLACEKD